MLVRTQKSFRRAIQLQEASVFKSLFFIFFGSANTFRGIGVKAVIWEYMNIFVPMVFITVL